VKSRTHDCERTIFERRKVRYNRRLCAIAPLGHEATGMPSHTCSHEGTPITDLNGGPADGVVRI
jgi:hypothetical protein